MARLLGTIAVVLALSSDISSAQTLAVADLGIFAGEWTLTLDSPQGSFEQSVVFKDEDGKAVAELSNQMQPEVQKVTDISKSGSDVVLKFAGNFQRSEEHTSELQSLAYLVCRLLLEKKNKHKNIVLTS